MWHNLEFTLSALERDHLVGSYIALSNGLVHGKFSCRIIIMMLVELQSPRDPHYTTVCQHIINYSPQKKSVSGLRDYISTPSIIIMCNHCVTVNRDQCSCCAVLFCESVSVAWMVSNYTGSLYSHRDTAIFYGTAAVDL